MLLFCIIDMNVVKRHIQLIYGLPQGDVLSLFDDRKCQITRSLDSDF